MFYQNYPEQVPSRKGSSYSETRMSASRRKTSVITNVTNLILATHKVSIPEVWLNFRRNLIRIGLKGVIRWAEETAQLGRCLAWGHEGFSMNPHHPYKGQAQCHTSAVLALGRREAGGSLRFAGQLQNLHAQDHAHVSVHTHSIISMLCSLLPVFRMKDDSLKIL